MISSIKHKQSISWTFLNDAMAISAKEMPKNHTDKERFAAAWSYIQTKGPDTRCNIASNIARNIHPSTWLHGRNISCNIARNISVFFKIVNYKYSFS